jgi:hypothetical protein
VRALRSPTCTEQAELAYFAERENSSTLLPISTKVRNRLGVTLSADEEDVPIGYEQAIIGSLVVVGHKRYRTGTRRC